jgi:hypothetical protein
MKITKGIRHQNNGLKKIASEQRSEHVSMKIPIVAKERDYIWRLIDR